MKEKAKNIKLVALDSLGVLFSEAVMVTPESLTTPAGEHVRMRSHIDGQGISYLRAAGFLVCFISSEKAGFIEALGEKLNNLPSVKNGTWKPLGVFAGDAGKDKVATLTKWAEENGATLGEVAYMGDDIGDLTVFKVVGFKAAPAQAEEPVKAAADFVAKRRGGDGAIRDLANVLMEAQGIDPEQLSRK
jgi:3-deoxy-D-manno-octulosonate 8-phosphate phosphatase (KDO 8-P phosphatase)